MNSITHATQNACGQKVAWAACCTLKKFSCDDTDTLHNGTYITGSTSPGATNANPPALTPVLYLDTLHHV